MRKKYGSVPIKAGRLVIQAEIVGSCGRGVVNPAVGAGAWKGFLLIGAIYITLFFGYQYLCNKNKLNNDYI